ncbi:MAG: ATP-binding protein [Saprospiraceae bacterium]|nr:ATP-binding protein [Saprospiraceae bacterium]
MEFKIYYIRISLLIIFLFSCFNFHAQTPRFKNYNSKDGLQASIVLTMEEDTKGFIYAGLKTGMCRFDGYEFVNYVSDPNDPYSIYDGRIMKILRARSGTMLVGSEAGFQFFDPIKEQFYPSFLDTLNPLNVINDVVSILEDKSGLIWVGTWDGLFCIESSRSLMTQQSFEDAALKGDIKVVHHPLREFFSIQNRTPIIWDIKEDPRGNRICMATNQGLLYYDLDTKDFVVPDIFDDNPVGYKQYETLHALNFDSNYNLWLGTENTCMVYDLEGSKFYDLPAFDTLSSIVMQITVDADSNIWVGLDGEGVFKFDQDFNFVLKCENQISNPYSLQENNVHVVQFSSKGNLMISNHLGFGFHDPKQKAFNHYFPTGKKGSIPLGRVEVIARGAKDRIWVGVDDAGVGCLNTVSNKFDFLVQDRYKTKTLNNIDITSVVEDGKGRIWIGTWGGGLNRIDSPLKTPLQLNDVEQLSHLDPDNPLNTNEIFSLLRDSQDDVWISNTKSGLIHYFVEADTFITYSHKEQDSLSIQSNWVYSVYEDRDARFWIATNAGVSSMKMDGSDFKRIDLPVLQKINSTKNIRTDSDGIVWAATEEGLMLYNPETGLNKIWNENDGLISKALESIEIDSYGLIWLGSSRGISRFNPLTERFVNYGQEDGVWGGGISRASLNAGADGIYFGSPNGVFHFYPDSIQEKDNTQRVVITDFLISNESVSVSAPDLEETPLLESISFAETIILSHDQNAISFKFSALDFLNPEKINYRYRLVGWSDKWIDSPPNRRFANFTNLSPGDYIFEVKSTSSDQVWSNNATKLSIRIECPWWESWWAVLTYIVAVFMALYFIYSSLSRRLVLKEQLKNREAEAIYLKELDIFKSKLYTNLTHEFRTPLTVILGMIQRIKVDAKTNLDTGVKMIERNGKILLRLINQLLDLSKLENNFLKLRMQQLDLVPHLNFLTSNFVDFAKEKGLALSFESTESELWLDYDADQIKQVVTNLIANAIKFSPNEGRIEIRLTRQNKTAQVEVRDTGIGIKKEDQEVIFKRFYQVDQGNERIGQGTGIGLAHTKELIDLMEGTIFVESALGQGARFIIQLPIKQKETKSSLNFSDKEHIPVPDYNMPYNNGGNMDSKPSLLIVEDNPDISNYLKTSLQEDYKLSFAPDGEAGIKLALEEIPDLILSDVMMPKKDGFELCVFLKNDLRTSHIPLILLTAKSDYESKIRGLKRGADVYMGKPFDENELKVQLKRLYEQQEKLKFYFKEKYPELQAGLLAEEIKESVEIEDEFIQKVRAIVDLNYGSDSFNLNELCAQLHMSRSQLFRKMKALIQISPSQFIRNYRLEKAKILLESGTLIVSEVAFDVGFKDAAHFSRLFSERFGVSPSKIKR